MLDGDAGEPGEPGQDGLPGAPGAKVNKKTQCSNSSNKTFILAYTLYITEYSEKQNFTKLARVASSKFYFGIS